MDEDTKRTLAKILTVTEDNNRMLHKMRRDALFGNIFRFIYWIVIIGFAIVSYYYLKPYLGQLDSLLKTAEKINGIKF